MNSTAKLGRDLTACAVSSAGDSLKQAQLNKLDAMISLAGITAEDHVLEIGCGWGSMAIRGAQTTGCRCALGRGGWVHGGGLRLNTSEVSLRDHWSQPLHVQITDILWPYSLHDRWTGITVSKEQLAEATQRVKAAGLSDRVTLLFCDYR